MDILITEKVTFIYLIATSGLAAHYFIKSKWIQTSVSILAMLIWIWIVDPFFFYARGLGTDSFIESFDFAVDEAYFFLLSLLPELGLLAKREDTLLAVIFIIICFFIWRKIILLSQKKIQLKDKYVSNTVVGVCFAVIALIIGYESNRVFQSYMKVKKINKEMKINFAQSSPQLDLRNSRLKIFIYIGESTSIMNMGIYGYPRDTTPFLSSLKSDADSGALFFDNVFSTHTHTSPSLLTALSFGTDPKEIYLPIFEQKRLSLIDILEFNGVDTFLISNQGQSGSWNTVSSLIFNKNDRIFSTPKGLGNFGGYYARPFDHEHFKHYLPKKLVEMKYDRPEVIFLHSYAGHIGYHHHIPEEFHSNIDSYYQGRNKESIFGSLKREIKEIESYDNAIRYIDFSISQVFELIKSIKEPFVFIYFSDHGDAVFTDRYHDSSRFLHEMVRVPFVMYFNESAQKSYADLWEHYRLASKSNVIHTLEQLSPTILHLLNNGISVEGIGTTTHLGRQKNIPIRIVKRRLSDSLSYVHLNSFQSQTAGEIDSSDSPTQIFAVSQANGMKGTNICYHRSNSIAAALRGSLVADCLEIDLVISSDGKMDIYHPPATNTGLKLEDILQIAEKRKKEVWIDGKNLNDVNACHALADYLVASKRKKASLFIEFPSNTALDNEKIGACISRLKKNNYRVSYYVPTGKAIECAKSLPAQHKGDTPACSGLKNQLKLVRDSGWFTDLSFDYSGIAAIENIPYTAELTWNTWHVQPQQFSSIDPGRFHNIILSTNDPNGI